MIFELYIDVIKVYFKGNLQNSLKGNFKVEPREIEGNLKRAESAE